MGVLFWPIVKGSDVLVIVAQPAVLQNLGLGHLLSKSEAGPKDKAEAKHCLVYFGQVAWKYRN